MLVFFPSFLLGYLYELLLGWQAATVADLCVIPHIICALFTFSRLWPVTEHKDSWEKRYNKGLGWVHEVLQKDCV